MVRDTAAVKSIHRTNLTMKIYLWSIRVSTIQSTSALGKLGTLLPRIAAFPLWSRMPSLPQRWAMASPSSCPCQCAPQLLHLLLRTLVPAAQGLRYKWEESNPLLPAFLLGPPELPVMGKVWGVTGLVGCPHHRGIVQGMNHRHVKDSIMTTCPESHQDVGRATVDTREQESPLLADYPALLSWAINYSPPCLDRVLR